LEGFALPPSPAADEVACLAEKLPFPLRENPARAKSKNVKAIFLLGSALTCWVTGLRFGWRAKSFPLLPPSTFLPARAFCLAREARHQFRSKKVRISSNKRTAIKLSGILPIDSAARSAAENGNTGSPRRRGWPSAGSKSLAILSICFAKQYE